MVAKERKRERARANDGETIHRHVRVHHGEKDRDDPLLRDVLNQRIEGLGGKTRRKRANTGPA